MAKRITEGKQITVMLPPVHQKALDTLKAKFATNGTEVIKRLLIEGEEKYGVKKGGK
jgi:hypothetical protein